MKNQIKTVLLLVSISGLFLWIGNALGGSVGLLVALAFSLLMNIGAYWFSDKLVLSIHKAQELKANDTHSVYKIVSELAHEANLPMPKVYLIPEQSPNAFATGRDPNHAAVAVTQGLIEILNKRELRGVLAHELAHIKNRDILISTIVAAFASAIMYLAHVLQWNGIFGNSQNSEHEESQSPLNPITMIGISILAPLVATLAQMAVSRTREFMADETGALTAGDPEALATALEKISSPKALASVNHAAAQSHSQPALAQLYIVNHFSGAGTMNLFSTHPPLNERIKRLRKMAQKKI